MGKFENIVIASDIDGTFLGNGSKTIPRNLEKIKYFCDNGGHFTFATGRLPIFMRKSLPYTKDVVNMPVVTGNGTCLYDFQKEVSVEDHFMTFENCMDLVRYCKELDQSLGFRGTMYDGFVVNSLDNAYDRREYENLSDFMNKRILPFEEWGQFDIYKTNVMGNSEKLKEIFPLLVERFSEEMNVSRAGYSAIEVMPYGTSKAIMLKSAVDRMFGKNVMLCTVGDHDNDLEMHSVADLAVCPANANDRVKDICKLCLCDNNHGVVADLIDYLDKTV